MTNRTHTRRYPSELRAGGRIARVFFCVHDSSMVLLYGFIKKSQKTPAHELDVTVKRMKGLENE